MDSLTRLGVDSVLVSIERCALFTDSSGAFVFDGVPPSESVSLEAVRDRYRSFRGHLATPPDVELAVVLAPYPHCDPERHPSLPRIETTDSAVVLNLTPPLAEALEAAAPGFTPQPRSDFGYWNERTYPYTCYQAPSAVIGDFNGDAVPDLAAHGSSNGTALGIVLISTPDGYRSFPREGHIPAGRYLVRVEAGTRRANVDGEPLALQNQGFRETGEMYFDRYIYFEDGEIRVWNYPFA